MKLFYKRSDIPRIASLLDKREIGSYIRYFCYFLLLYPLLHIAIHYFVPSLPLFSGEKVPSYTIKQDMARNWIFGIIALSIDFFAALLILKKYFNLGWTILKLNTLIVIFHICFHITFFDHLHMTPLSIAHAGYLFFFYFIINFFLGWKIWIFYFLQDVEKNKEYRGIKKIRKNSWALFKNSLGKAFIWSIRFYMLMLLIAVLLKLL